MSQFDLDAVVDVINGWSEINPGWQGFIVYLPDQDRFVELMSMMPDVRGNSDDQAVEVQAGYIKKAYDPFE